MIKEAYIALEKVQQKLNFYAYFCFSAEPFFFQFIKFSAFLHFFKRFVELLGQIASLLKAIAEPAFSSGSFGRL